MRQHRKRRGTNANKLDGRWPMRNSVETADLLLMSAASSLTLILIEYLSTEFRNDGVIRVQ